MPWKQKLIDKLAMARGRKVGNETVEGILDQFESMGEAISRKIIGEICLLDNLPSNLYGAIEKKYNEVCQLKKESECWKFNKREHSEADKYPADVMALWDFVQEHMLWHKQGLITETYKVAMLDIDEWIKSDRPVMCCRLHDTWMHGFESAYKKELCNPGCNAIANQTREYTKKLIDFRLKNTAE